tara:strand:+ start:3746 stop:3928 length:183 start_codon:yes stop_codon:yes gene_type:complete
LNETEHKWAEFLLNKFIVNNTYMALSRKRKEEVLDEETITMLEEQAKMQGRNFKIIWSLF